MRAGQVRLTLGQSGDAVAVAALGWSHGAKVPNVVFFRWYSVTPGMQIDVEHMAPYLVAALNRAWEDTGAAGPVPPGGEGGDPAQLPLW